MAKRGRKSASELDTVLTLTQALPPPEPYDLDEAAAEIWRLTTNALPTSFFPAESWPMLGHYCRHCAAAQLLGREIDRFKVEWLREDEGPGRLNQLLIMRDRECRAAASLATKLRLTAQSRYQPSKAASMLEGRSGNRPWDAGEH